MTLATAIQNYTFSSFKSMDDSEKTKLWLQTVLWGAAIYVSATLGVLGYCVTQLNNLNQRFISIEATSFTSRDADKLREAVQTLGLKIATMPQENPPKWLTDQVSRLQAEMDAIRRK